MEHDLRDLPHAVHGDSRALFDGERMFGGLELDVGALTNRAGVDMRLQVEGRGRVDLQFGGEPAEIRLLSLAAQSVPQICTRETFSRLRETQTSQENTSSVSITGISIKPLTK
ncbi:hypothetical protein ADL25_20565 [Streptomyces sp. NRRL F-5122]|nr:hypothetical protein ADL25_20565 [Streptomyces sp. NRRL F-5122]